jgi:peptidoglycan hydrolase CwlO-like protein
MLMHHSPCPEQEDETMNATAAQKMTLNSLSEIVEQLQQIAQRLEELHKRMDELKADLESLKAQKR